MAQQTINVGTSANDGTGDSLRAAMQKINANDTELYTNKFDKSAIDTDSTLAANSDTKVASQKATKAALASFVTGPASVTADRVALFNGTTGKIIKDSGKALPTGAIVGTSDTQTLTGKTISGADNTLTVREADLSTTDVTTGNASTSKHGFAPKFPNDATKYLDGTGAFSVPAGGGAAALSGLSDVDVTEGSGIDGYSLVWNNTSGKWEASNIASGGGGAGTVNSGTSGQLSYYGSSGAAVSGNANVTVTLGALTLGVSGTAQGSVKLSGSTSGTTELKPAAVASGVLTMPATTDTLVGKATTDTLTNKTLDTAGIGNSLKVNGIDLTGAMTSYAATIDSTAGTVTATQNLKYARMGKLCFVTGSITITSASGTSSGIPRFTLPFTAAASAIAIFNGREDAHNGKQYHARVLSGATLAALLACDGTTPGILNGDVYYVTGWYEVA